MNTDGVFYHGCWGRCGHYLYRPGQRHAFRDLPADFPVRPSCLDAGFLGEGNGPQVEGKAVLSHVGGWTILSFWDRTGDSRPNSNSSLAMRGTWGFATVIANFKSIFPEVWGRFTFPVELASAPADAPNAKAVA